MIWNTGHGFLFLSYSLEGWREYVLDDEMKGMS
jgi:hypothetical protein